MEDPNLGAGPVRPAAGRAHPYLYLVVLLIASAVYLGCIVSPPSLMDDVDAVQAQLARNMLTYGDWVTGRLGRSCARSTRASPTPVFGLPCWPPAWASGCS
ncbi:MAG TPA: hypothetical protein VMT28_02200 [Terriglobales bacterium]|nr:hypothetical protein [Terriglobales bacterium]